MKRPTKNLSDMDVNGRVRREVPNVDPRPLVEAKFLDGPIAGQTRMVARGADLVTVGPWTYSRAGKEGRTPLYCKVPNSRRDRKLLAFVKTKRGVDPREQMAQMRRTPAKRTAPPAAGRGARKRAEARALRTGQAAWRASDGYNGA